MPSYKQTLADLDYLWDTYACPKDMTGGYEDQYDLDELLRNPTKKKAAELMANQIRYWFQVGPEPDFLELKGFTRTEFAELLRTDKTLLKLRKRYVGDDEVGDIIPQYFT